MSSDDSSPQSLSLLEAFLQRGWLMADTVIEHLKSVGLLPKRGRSFVRADPAILMELSSSIRLGTWLAGGLCDGISPD